MCGWFEAREITLACPLKHGYVGAMDETGKSKLNLGSEHSETAVNAEGKNLAAVLLGRRGGLRGGPARAARLSPDERAAIARRAAEARWAKERK